MQLYAVNFVPLLGPLYMFWVFYTPIIRSTIYNCIYSHWYKPKYRPSYLFPAWPAGLLMDECWINEMCVCVHWSGLYRVT